jgi:hypothetical protein
MDDLQKNTLAALPDELRERIDAHITARLVAFYEGMVRRGQIKDLPAIEDAGTTVDCRADRAVVSNQSR